MIKIKFFTRKVFIQILFCNYNEPKSTTPLWESEGAESDLYLWLTDPDADPGGPKAKNTDPDPEHCPL